MTKSDDNENKIIAQRYAYALTELKNDRISKEDILNQITDIHRSLSSSEDLKNLMNSPVISLNQKKDILGKIFFDSDAVIVNFLKLLVDKNRFSIFESIVNEYKHMMDKEHHILDIKVTSAIDFSDSEKDIIKEKMKNILNREIEVEWTVNSDIIGGLVFEANDNILDCSIQHKLQEIKKEITV